MRSHELSGHTVAPPEVNPIMEFNKKRLENTFGNPTDQIELGNVFDLLSRNINDNVRQQIL